MEWWPINPEACAPTGPPAGAGVQFSADSSLEQQLPPLLQHQHQQQQQHHQNHNHQQQQQEQNQSAGDFDPWLACDDLELGTIIQQVSSGVMSSPSSDASMNQTALVGGGCKQEEPYGDSNHLAAIQSRRGSENKQHIINIINNSLPAAYQQAGGQQEQRRNNSMTTNSSIAVSPFSSSLGSSPLNSLSSNYSSLSPHSPPLTGYSQPSGQERHQSNQTYAFGNNDAEFQRHQQQLQQQQHQHQAQPFCGSNSRLALASSGSNIVTSTHHGTINNSAQASGAKASGGANRYNQSKTSVASSQVQGASLLLTHQKPQAKQPTRQARKTPNVVAEAANLGGQAHKQRRCRHITDFVLADEERRLLIKEGHTDFPMDCQLRPLTKMEERILRKIRRKIRNKKSAQCSRQRKKEYVEDLERKYAETVRENIELKQLLAKIHSSSESHHQELQFKTVPAPPNQMQTFSDDCGEPQTSCEPDSVEMHWKDLFQSESVADRMNALQRQQAQQTTVSMSYD